MVAPVVATAGNAIILAGAAPVASVQAVQMALLGGAIGGAGRTLENLIAGGRSKGDPAAITDTMNERFPKTSATENAKVRYVYEGVAAMGQEMVEKVAEERQTARQAGWHAVIGTTSQVSSMLGTAALFGANAPLLGVVSAGTLDSMLVNADNPATKYYGKRSPWAKALGYIQAAIGPVAALVAGMLGADNQQAAIVGGVARGLTSFIPSNLGVERDSKPYKNAYEKGLDLLAQFEAGLIDQEKLLADYKNFKAELDIRKRDV